MKASTFVVALATLFLLAVVVSVSAKKPVDPKHCEVCKKVIGDIHAEVKKLDKKKQKNKEKIEAVTAKYCKNKKLDQKAKKVCYYIDPIKREVSTPMAMGAPVDRICKKLEKKNANICTVKYKIKTEKGKTDYSKMRVKHLKSILADRGVTCTGCVDKSEFVKKAQESEHLEM
jgi:mesencephalic astrocyte-derived neurotrophic factor